MDRFRELDVLRGIAALSVVLFHYSIHVVKYFGDFPFRFEAGKYGVSLFFCVSGFVIFWTLERSKSLTDFAFSRFTRLYPTYWTAILLWGVVTVGIFGNEFWPLAYAVNVTMLQSFVGVPDLSEPFWTLGIELAFYFWMALLFRMGWLKHIVPICVGWLVASALWAGMGEAEVWRTVLVLPYAPYFTAGMMFYLLRKARPRPAEVTCHGPAIAGLVARRVPATPRREGASILLVIVLAWLVVTMRDGMTGAMVAGACFAAMYAAISGWMTWAVNRGTVLLGTVSYALYVTHSLGVPWLTVLHELGVPSLVAVPAMMVLAVALAAAVTFAIEQPAMRVLRGWWKSVPRPAVA